jgi:hypothetical protein
MIWQIDDTRMPEFLRVTLDGEPSPEEYVQFWTEVLAHESWTPGLAVLVDGTHRTPYGDRAAAVAKAVAEFFATHADQFGESPVASIVKKAEYSQFDRVVEYSARLRGSRSILRYFTNEPDATDWLKHISRTRGYSD